MNEDLMNEDEIKPIRNRVRRIREEYETTYYLEAIAFYTPPLKRQSSEVKALSNDVLLLDRTPKAIKSKVGISTQSLNISLVVSDNLLSDRTPKAIKSTNVRDRDLNFDRDNPSSLVLSSTKASSQDDDDDDDDDEPSTMLFKKWKDKREANEAKVRQLRQLRERERVRRGYRVERRKRRKAESKHTIVISSTSLKQKSEATAPSNKDPTLINKTEIALLTKAIKSKLRSTNIRDRDLNFDRDNPSSSVLSSNIFPPSSELKLVPYKVLLHRTANNIKPPQSSPNDIKLQQQLSSSNAPPLSSNDNNIINGLNNNNAISDTRINVTAVKLPSVQSIKPPSMELPSLPSIISLRLLLQQQLSNDTKVQPSPDNHFNVSLIKLPPSVSYNLLLDRTPKAIKSPLSSSERATKGNDTYFDCKASPSLKLPSPLKASPLSNNNNSKNNDSNNNVLNRNNNNNNKVSIIITAPDTNITPAITGNTINVVKYKILGTIHTTKYDVTENHVTQALPYTSIKFHH
jgi:hypothetical protein